MRSPAFLLFHCRFLQAFFGWGLAMLAGGITAESRGDDWPAWRGPEGTGVSRETAFPTHWSPVLNVRWRTALPEPGNSTPIVVSNRVFLTQPVSTRVQLRCVDRETGRELWQAGPEVSEDGRPTHETNPFGSSSPVSDGDTVVAWFGSAGIAAYDFEGRRQWHRDLGAVDHIWGYGSSPVLLGEMCYVNFGPGERSFLVALDKRTGRTVWQRENPGGDSGRRRPGQDQPVWIGSWSTPLAITWQGRTDLILCWPGRVLAVDPTTGQEHWTCTGLNPLVYTSPLFDPVSGLVVAMGGYSGQSLAVQAGGQGDVTATHRRWHHPRTKQRIGSGVLHDGHIFILNDPGVAECFELTTGRRVWEERLKGPGPKSDNWSSMVAAGDRLYAINQGGDAFVLRASPRFEVIATNAMGETTIASLALSRGQVFIRTHAALWCIAENARAPQGARR